MSERQRYTILDIGIGAGGNYVGRDLPGTHRIGVDVRPHALVQVVGKYGLTVWEAAAENLEATGKFTPQSVNEIQSLFPHDSLLYHLAKPRGLWDTFGRLLVPGGRVVTVFDVPSDGYRVFRMSPYTVRLDDPLALIAESAKVSGFVTTAKKLTPYDVDYFKTQFSGVIRKNMKRDPEHAVYAVVATKHRR